MIAARYLLPAAARLHGLAVGDVELTDDAVLAIVARRRAEGDGSKAVITPETAAAMLGTPTFIEMDVTDRLGRPGVARALGWTSYGGDVMFVEAARMPGGGGLTMTGSLDDDFRESIWTALSWLRANAGRYRLDAAVFGQTDLHVHVQSLADSRRGGSAGLAVAAALTSSLTGRPVPGRRGPDRRAHPVRPRSSGCGHQGEGARRRPPRVDPCGSASAERPACRGDRGRRFAQPDHRARRVAGRRGARSRSRSGLVGRRRGRGG